MHRLYCGETGGLGRGWPPCPDLDDLSRLRVSPDETYFNSMAYV